MTMRSALHVCTVMANEEGVAEEQVEEEAMAAPTPRG
jgi:hypothetical protein|eukprot:CAMPEP_0174310914 /NCGR_PEP_ID=MMETSP0810-20121108/3365_1 /TAXON_ID=73025 ORGANISM="Eutreptiella gymnastica-like, Strain CCMP1594" /NCGR_SAMPLE_ID=MMETSP0810 /ASSEMBLY_ACC=CAM_ASM_000659 /LENGTH=36 /DNA_ID= /DNA_START= /DNA_END= /DNA_ORIENTATION=